MTSFPIPAGVVVLTGFNGNPRDPQPATITAEEAGNGVIGRWPDGTEKNINTPAPEPPPRYRALTKFEFINLFTTQEQAAAIALKATTLAVFWLNYDAATAFERDHPATEAGFAALVATGVLTQERADAILAAWPAA